ncbi:MAG: FAD-binding oxidoreductase [Alphaproteobacteria bacterium]|nr:FAD-binding oxidoreductase [Alphaproteobacteria bacterium]
MNVHVRRAGRVLLGLVGLSGFAGVAFVVWLERAPNPLPAVTVHDVTELVQIGVERVVRPTSVDDLREVVRRHDGPVSIGGGRYSMGGQIGTDGTLFLDMRGLDRVLDLDVDARVVRVQAGITWRALIEALDPHDLSVAIMQSYADFTVGGTLSVNAHGRYMGRGPVVHSVRSILLLLADGSLVRCSREENAELFFGAIGGYGGLGVIVEAELDVAPNTMLERRVDRMPFADFPRYFAERVQGDPGAVMFNADLYPPDYDDLVAITFRETDAAPTVGERLQPRGGSTSTDRLMYWWVSEGPLGKETRAEVIDRMRLGRPMVVPRNYEASYDVAGLDPGSRAKNTYVLQEYFVPVERLASFRPRMARIFREHDVNVVNVSIRHAEADPDTLLTWCPTDCYAFVVYHKMATTPEAWEAAGTWTRAMADALIEEGGRWYLPYQIHATPEQLAAAYPGAPAFFDLKKRVDPDYVFRNRLFDRYLPPGPDYGGLPDEAAIRARLAARPTWLRPADQTFLTLPEWLVVYSADELGAFLAHERPSAFPYLAAVSQFWNRYRAVWAVCRERYAFNGGYHAMIAVVGASYTVEMVGKGLYEGTVGRLFEGGGRTAQEDHYARVTADYGAFTHHTPWYAFPFAERRAELGSLPAQGGTLRQWERSFASRVELTLKGWWAGAIASATGAAYAPEAERIELWVRADPAALAGIPGVEVVETLGGRDLLVTLPRYEPFTAAAVALASRDVEVVEIAGARSILVQVVVPTGADVSLWGATLTRWPILTRPEQERVAMEIPVHRLDDVLPALTASGYRLEHLYDF